MGSALGDGEGGESLSGSDRDELLDEDMEALRRACMLTRTNPNEVEEVSAGLAAASDSEANDSETDDVELLRSIQQRFSVQLEDEGPLVLKPLRTLPPATGSDDEEDFETFRAIQRRFAKYDSDALKKTESTFVHDPNTSLTSEQDTADILFANGTTGEALDNEFPDYEDACSAYEYLESVSDGDPRSQPLGSIEWDQPVGHVLSSIPRKYSTFHASGEVFIDAIKKNRSCQRFIRSKLIEVEARIEENKKLLERMKVLKDFQSSCKRRAGRALAQKKDVRAQLILVQKSKNSQNLKANGKKASALFYGPVENSHVQSYRTVLTTLFPLSLHRQPWSQVEKENLAKGIKQQIQETLFDKSLVLYSGSERSSGASDAVDNIIASIADLEITPEILRSFLPKMDWQRLASLHFMGRSGAECEARWLNCEDPLINHNAWTKYEDKKLLHLLQERGTPYNWIDIASKLETNRTPFQCLARYQRSLNNHMIKRDWTTEEDAQLCASVEAFGEGNWQLIASNLEGRTGTQCSNRWRKTLHPSRKTVGRWTVDEDKCLKVAVMLFGPKSWSKIAKFVPGRTQVQCRERWVNVLDPSLKLGEWTEEEDNKLEAAIKEHGYCWSKVAAAVPPRTDSQCRRRWKVLFPHEVPLLQATRKIQKAALICNFVDRESERPELGAGDFLPLPGTDSIPYLENENNNGKGKIRSSDTPKRRSKRSRANKAEIYPEEALNLTNDDDAETIGIDDTSSKKRKTSKLPSKRKKYAKSVQDHQDHSSTPRDSTCLRAMNGDIDAIGGNDATKEKKTLTSLSRSNKSTKPAPDHQSLSLSTEDSTLRIRNADDVETSGVDYATSNKKNAAKACPRKRKHSEPLQDGHDLNDSSVGTTSMDDFNPKQKKKPNTGPDPQSLLLSAEDSGPLKITTVDDVQTPGVDYTDSIKKHRVKACSERSKCTQPTQADQTLNENNVGITGKGDAKSKNKKDTRHWSKRKIYAKSAHDHQNGEHVEINSVFDCVQRNKKASGTSGLDYATSKKKNKTKACPKKRKQTDLLQDTHDLYGNNVGTISIEDINPKNKKKPNTGPGHQSLSFSAEDSGLLKITNVDNVQTPGVDYTTSKKKKNVVKACSERSKCTEPTQGYQNLNGNNVEITGGGDAKSKNEKDPTQCSKRKIYAKSAHDHQNGIEINGGDNSVRRKRNAFSSCSKRGKCVSPTQDHQVHTSSSERLTSLWIATVEDVETAGGTIPNCELKVHEDKFIAPQTESQDLSLPLGQQTFDIIDASLKVGSRVADVAENDGSEKFTKDKPYIELTSEKIGATLSSLLHNEDKCVQPELDSQDLSLCSGQSPLDIIDTFPRGRLRTADVADEGTPKKLTKDNPCSRGFLEAMDGDDLILASLLQNKVVKTGLRLANNGTISATSEAMDGDDTTLASLLHNKVMKKSHQLANKDTIAAALPVRSMEDTFVLLSEKEKFAPPPEDGLGSNPMGASDATLHVMPESGAVHYV